MDIVWLIPVGIAVTAAAFGKPALTFIGKKLVGMDLQKGLNQAELKPQEVKLSNGLTAHYFERRPKGKTDEPTLVVLPGATVNMHFMGARMSRLFTQMPNRHIVVVELPHHGQNLTVDLNFKATAESTIAMAEHLEEVRKALGLEEAFDLIGYSLGGGIATEYAVQYPQQIKRLVLLAPYFYELATDGFVEAIDSDGLQNIHGWETMDQMKNFFHNWLGLTPADAPPAFIMRGINALRADHYPSGYWRACLRYVHQHSTDSHTIMTNRTDQLAAVQRPTLVVTASDDAICDPQKLRRLEDAFGSEYCTMKEVPSGHTFGAGGATLFDIASDDMRQFLAV